MAEQVLAHLEFLHGELKRLPSSHNFARHEVHGQVVLLQLQDLIWAATAQERTDSRQQLRERKGLDEIIVSAAVESMDAIIDGILRRKNQDGRLEPTLAQSDEDLETVAPRQHEVQNHKIERLVVHEEKPFFARAGDTDVIVLRLEPITKGLRYLPFVLDDQDTHGTQEYSDPLVRPHLT